MTAHRRIYHRQRKTKHDFVIITVLAPEPRTGPERSPLLTHSKWTVCFCGEYRPGGRCGDCGYETPRIRRLRIARTDAVDRALAMSLRAAPLDRVPTKL
jgi:hypothetical protein